MDFDGLIAVLGAIQNDVISVVAIVAPIAIAIFGIFFVWKKGIKYFKSLAGSNDYIDDSYDSDSWDNYSADHWYEGYEGDDPDQFVQDVWD